ncbi:MAG: winged helix-turn-helix domain-containing protein [Candidatus Thermoplasmatota archaeon]|nr:winged helix-turn-helix domain-containing protein [Candidatus Thermoplasmatota archaeon]
MTKDDKVQTVNQKTGEKKEGYFVYVAYPKPKITGNRWMMTFQDSLAIIATDDDMTGQTLKVLLLLMSELEFENYITIKQVAVAEKLKMHKPDVSKAMRILVNKGIILKVKEGTTTGYKLNPHYGWKGKVSNMEAEIKRIGRQRVVDMQQYRDAAEKEKPNT